MGSGAAWPGPSPARGAKVFLVGRTRERLDAVADDIASAGGSAEVAEVAAFLASDRAAGVTGTMTNVTSGLVLR